MAVHRRWIAGPLAACCAAGAVHAAGTVYVDDDAPSSGDGASWASAYRFLQDALASAGPGDEIRIGQGTYRPDRSEREPSGSADPLATFAIEHAMVVRGGYAGLGAADPDANDPSSYRTVLSGDLAGDDASADGVVVDNSRHVVTIGASATTLAGVVVSGGNAVDTAVTVGGGVLILGVATTLERCRLIGNRADEGGGLAADRATVTLDGCAIDRNSAGRGGGLRAHGATLRFSACRITDNSAVEGGGMLLIKSSLHAARSRVVGNQALLRGAGVFVLGGTVGLEDCILASNVSGDRGGGLSAEFAVVRCTRCKLSGNIAELGGAGDFVGGSATFDDCLIAANSSGDGAGLAFSAASADIAHSNFAGNVADEDGGALSFVEGSTATISGCAFDANDADSEGACIYTNESSPIVVDCTFVENHASFRGGGIAAYGGAPIVTHCSFIGNVCDSWSGAIFTSKCDATIVSCEFRENVFAVALEGKDLAVLLDCNFIDNTNRALWTSSATAIVGCRFTGNSSPSGEPHGGGAVINWQSADGDGPMFVDCVFAGNHSPLYGGAMHTFLSTPIIANCVFTGNTSAGSGAAMYFRWSNALVSNCTIVGNSGPTAAIYVWQVGTPVFSNLIVWGNASPKGIVAVPTGLGVTVKSSIVQGGWSGAGSGNLVVAPIFVDAAGPDGVPGTLDDDFRLAAGSPGIDAGTNAALPADLLDLDGDGDTAEPLPLDIAGAPRIVDDPATPDGGTATVDMGAYEYQPSNGLARSNRGAVARSQSNRNPFHPHDPSMIAKSAPSMMQSPFRSMAALLVPHPPSRSARSAPST